MIAALLVVYLEVCFIKGLLEKILLLMFDMEGKLISWISEKRVVLFASYIWVIAYYKKF